MAKNDTEAQQVAAAPIVVDPEIEKWNAYLETLDPFTREQVELADQLDVEYRAIVEKREANRELLRYLARSGKVSREVVDDLYKPKVATRPRKLKGESPEDYKARTGVDLPT